MFECDGKLESSSAEILPVLLMQLGVITGILLFSHSTPYQRPFAGLGDWAQRCAPACLRTDGAMGISL